MNYMNHRFSLLLCIASLIINVAKADDDVKHITFKNSTNVPVSVKLSPGRDGYVSLSTRWASQQYDRNKPYSEQPGLGGWKDFVIQPHEAFDAKCFDCDFFHFISNISFQLGDSNRISTSQECNIEGASPLFKMSCSAMHSVIRGIFIGDMSTYYVFNDTGKELTVEVSKESGAWYDFDMPDPLISSHSIALKEAQFTRIQCVECGGSIIIRSIFGDKHSFRIRSNQLYDIAYFDNKLDCRNSIHELPKGPAAEPPSGVQYVYIVNGTSQDLEFEMMPGIGWSEDKGTTLPNGSSQQLLAREGATFTCPSICTASIKTADGGVIKGKVRDLTTGKSYMIVWDNALHLYDFRTYTR